MGDSLSYLLWSLDITYFTVVQTKTYTFHLSTLPKYICSYTTTAKKRFPLSKIVFLRKHEYPITGNSFIERVVIGVQALFTVWARNKEAKREVC